MAVPVVVGCQGKSMTIATPIPPDLLRPSAAARTAGVSERTIRVWLRAGRLPHVRMPLGRPIDPTTLGLFIAEREAPARAHRPARRLFSRWE
jgi:hypothetical protein